MSSLYFVLDKKQSHNNFSQYASLLALTLSLERKRSAPESQHFLVKLGCHDMRKIKRLGH